MRADKNPNQRSDKKKNVFITQKEKGTKYRESSHGRKTLRSESEYSIGFDESNNFSPVSSREQGFKNLSQPRPPKPTQTKKTA
jgi:hypothetical protein